MTYRDEQAALSQRMTDLELRLTALRRTRASLADALGDEQSVVSELAELRKKMALSAAELRKRLPLVQQLEVASPCNAPWDAMKGDDKQRFCSQCEKHVYNVSAMSTPEAETLLASAVGSVCVRLFRRADGTVLTQDCPVGLRAKKRRRLAAVLVATAAVAAAAMGALGVLQRHHAAVECSRMSMGSPPPLVANPQAPGVNPPTVDRQLAQPVMTMGDVPAPRREQPFALGEAPVPTVQPSMGHMSAPVNPRHR